MCVAVIYLEGAPSDIPGVLVCILTEAAGILVLLKKNILFQSDLVQIEISHTILKSPSQITAHCQLGLVRLQRRHYFVRPA